MSLRYEVFTPHLPQPCVELNQQSLVLRSVIHGNEFASRDIYLKEETHQDERGGLSQGFEEVLEYVEEVLTVVILRGQL